MADDFDKITGDFHLDLETQSEIREAAAIHAAYYHRLVDVHKIPQGIAADFTTTFIQAAIVDPDA